MRGLLTNQFALYERQNIFSIGIKLIPSTRMTTTQPFPRFFSQIHTAVRATSTSKQALKKANSVEQLETTHIQLLKNIKQISTQTTNDPLGQVEEALQYQFQNPDLTKQIAKFQYNLNVPKAFNLLGKSVLKLLIVERLVLATNSTQIPNAQLSAALSAARFAELSNSIGLDKIVPDQLTGPPSAKQISENFCQLIASLYLDTDGDMFKLQQILDPCLKTFDGEEEEDEEENSEQGGLTSDNREAYFNNLRCRLVRLSGTDQGSLSEANVKDIFVENSETFIKYFPMYVGKKGYKAEFMLTAFSTIQGWNKKMSWLGFPIIELAHTEALAICLLEGQDMLVGQEIIQKKYIANVCRDLGLAGLIHVAGTTVVDKQIAEMLAAAMAGLYVDGGSIHLPAAWLAQNLTPPQP